jgi:hypothetical protein
MAEKGINEERITAASYIINFYQDIQGLTHAFANYINYMTFLETKYDKIEPNKWWASDNESLIELSQKVRFFATKTFIAYSAINARLETKLVGKDINALYVKVKKDLIVKRDDISEYVIAMNMLLVTNIFKSLLETSNEVLKKLYGDIQVQNAEQQSEQ